LFFYNFSASIFSNSLPLVILAIGLGPLEVSISSFIVNLVFISFASHAGSLGDRTGARRAIMILGILFLAIAIGAVVSVYSYPMILIASAISGFASALFSSNAVMAVVEAGSLVGERRPEVSLAHAGLASGSGWFLGLLLGGVFVKALGLRGALLVAIPLAALAIISTVLSQGPLIELEREILAKPHTLFLGVAERIRMIFYYIPKMGNPLKASRRVMYDPFRSFLMAMMLAFLAISLFFTQIPVFMRRVLGVPDGDVMMLMSIHNGISTVIFALLGFNIIRIRPASALQLALALRSLAFLLPLLSYVVSYRLVLPITFLTTGTTWALINVSTNSIVLNMGGAERGGEKIGQLNGSISLGIVVGSLLSGVLVHVFGFKVNFIVASLTVFVSLLWIRRLLGH
jgi:MFS family permease